MRGRRVGGVAHVVCLCLDVETHHLDGLHLDARSRLEQPTLKGTTIPMPNPSILKGPSQPSSEPKPRGANRSTKAAGKLKVLPEQPDLLEVNRKPEWDAPGPSNDPEESVGTTGDSDDADPDDDEPEVRTTRTFCSTCFSMGAGL